MPRPEFFAINRHNSKLLLVLGLASCCWSLLIVLFWYCGQFLEEPGIWWAFAFISVQLLAAMQLLMPALVLIPQERRRGFYLFWGGVLGSACWLLSLTTGKGLWAVVIASFKSGLLLLTATLIGVVLARYVKSLWEVLPVCLVMSLADLLSWAAGPTAHFSAQIEAYYRAPEGAAPLIDMVLLKLAMPGNPQLLPVFGLSDWVMVSFFAMIARRFYLRDNLFPLMQQHRTVAAPLWRPYVPISGVALLAALALAYGSQAFVPVLPLLAFAVLGWYLLLVLIKGVM